MTGATNWTPYSVPELAGILDDDLSNAWEQVGAWFSADAMLDDASAKLTAARAGLAAVWPPESSPAAQTFFQVVDALTESMSKTALAANTNANALSQVLDNHSDTKSKVDGLHSAWTANQKLASFDPNEFPSTSAWQSSLNIAAQQHMAAADNVINEYTSALIVPPVIPVPGWFDQSTVIPGSDGTPAAPGGGSTGIGGPGDGIPVPPGPTSGGPRPPGGSIPPLPGVPILTGGGPPSGGVPGQPPLGPGQTGLPLPPGGPGGPGGPGAPGPGAPGIPMLPIPSEPIPSRPLLDPPATGGGSIPGRGPGPGSGTTAVESGAGGGSATAERSGGAIAGEPGGGPIVGRPGGRPIVGEPVGGVIDAPGGSPIVGETGGGAIGGPGIAGRSGFAGGPTVGAPGEGGIGFVGGTPSAGGLGVGGGLGASGGLRAAGVGGAAGVEPLRSGATRPLSEGGSVRGEHMLGRDGVLRPGGQLDIARGVDVVDGASPSVADGTLRPRAIGASTYSDGPGAAPTLAPPDATTSAPDEGMMPMMGGPSGSSRRRWTRRAAADMTWVVPTGGPAVLIPESEHEVHDPGPGVIGIDR